MSFSKSFKQKAGQVWEDGYKHPFVQELGKGTLAKDKFAFYLVQDYLYLLQYAKVFALAAVKAPNEELLAKLTSVQHNILHTEMDMHRAYMASYGITTAQVQVAQASLFNRTYTANMLAVGGTGDLAEILAAVFPCAWTYADYASRLKEAYKDAYMHNPYKSWIDTYADPSFAETYEWLFDAIDALFERKTEVERKRVEEIFTSSVEFEYLFWDMAYKKELSYHL